MNFTTAALSEVFSRFISNPEQANEEEMLNLTLITSIALGAIGLCVYGMYQRASNPTELHPSDNQLAGIDLSQNSQLQTLYLIDNHLAAIDLSQNSQLQTLNLSQNQLAAIDLSQNSQLQTLTLSWNPLTAIDLSQNSRLQTLELADNQLAAIDLSQNSQLQTLELWNNQLAVIDLSQNSQLQTLDLSLNQLAAIDLSQNSQLQTLYLSQNQLAAIDLSQNSQLQTLYLSQNQLAAIDLSQNSRLQTIFLEENQLATIDLSQNSQLQMLDLQRNQLTSIHLSQNSQLQTLDLRENCFTELPDSILSLPRTCVIAAEHNQFTLQYEAYFQQRLRQHRLAHPDQGPTVYMSFLDRQQNPVSQSISLEGQLAAWSQEFETALLDAGNPSNVRKHFAGLYELDENDRSLIANFLQRLRETKDYTNGGTDRQNTIFRTQRMLRLADQNPTFRKMMLSIIQQGLVTCGDRVQLYFDEIEIAWHFHCRELSPEAFRDLAIRAERCRQLQLHAEHKAEDLGLEDEIETILYYRVHLKDELQLPVSTRNMLFPGISRVTNEMLNTAKTEILKLSDEELLATSQQWQDRIQQLHRERTEALTNHYGNLLADFEDYMNLESAEEQNQYLEKKQDLKELLGKAINCEIPIEYAAVAEFINFERQKTISKLA